MGKYGVSARPRRSGMAALWLLILALTTVGCSALGSALQTAQSLQDAGYHDPNVTVMYGTGLPPGGVVKVSYSSGPAGDDRRDVPNAAKVVWDTYPGRFGVISIIRQSGGCVGPACATRSDELASATYAQLAATFGPRPHGLDQATGHLPASVIELSIAGAVVLAAIVAIAVTLIVRQNRKRKRRAAPPPWPPGPPVPPA